MKTVCQIQVFSDKVSKECFLDLVKAYPEGLKFETFFKLELQAGHPLIANIIEILQKHGRKLPPNSQLYGCPGYISIVYKREFEAADFVEARYLEVAVDPDYYYVTENKRTAKGSIIIKADSIERRHPVAGDMSYGIFVSDTVRELLLKQNFQHLQFRSCVIRGERSESFDDFPIWEMTSDLVLPYLSPTCKFYDEEGRPVSGNSDLLVGLDDNLHEPSQLLYRAKDLKKAAPFDVALTREKFFGENPTALVVSQRFYQFCMKKKYKLYAIPVRIDPD